MGNKTAFMNNISTISTQNSKTHKTEKKLYCYGWKLPFLLQIQLYISHYITSLSKYERF